MSATPGPARTGVDAEEYVGIRRLAHRYADAVVHRDPEAWGAVWSADAVWELGRGREVQGREAILDLWRTAMGGMYAVVQTVDNGDAWHTPDGGVAGRWYVSETYRRTDPDGGPGEAGILRAHYDDTYVAAEDGWLFASRRLVVHYAGPADLSGTFFNTTARFGGNAV